MDKHVYNTYCRILETELIMATGCTEPIAVAYAGAKAKELLGKLPEKVDVKCSGNIIKNVKGVVVPQSGGRRGIAPAALIGIVGGNPDKVLDVLADVTEADINQMAKLLEAGICATGLVEGVANLYIDLYVEAGDENARVIISDYHNNIIKMEKNGKVVYEKGGAGDNSNAPDKSLMNVKDILEFADCVDIEDVRGPIENQIKCNVAISQEGLTNKWGAEVGRTLTETNESGSLKVKACAAAAAGSDARMAGCAMPVVINSGSGNQGITTTLPVVTYAEAYNVPHDKLIRGMVVSDLIALLQKRYIGSLSAYCGAVSAACGAACGIAYMLDLGTKVIEDTITNTICTTGGIVCDGAKSSCGAKINASVHAALTALDMAKKGRVFQPGEGLTFSNIEDTIANVGYMGREGMRSTDITVLNLMLQNNPE
jgi:L-cysteine desulfidase